MKKYIYLEYVACSNMLWKVILPQKLTQKEPCGTDVYLGEVLDVYLWERQQGKVDFHTVTRETSANPRRSSGAEWPVELFQIGSTGLALTPQSGAVTGCKLG